MPGTSTANWRAAMSHGTVKPVWAVSLQVSASKTFYAASGPNALGYDVALLSPPYGVSTDVDPLTRRTSIGVVDVDFDDSWMRPIVTDYRVRSAILTLKLGTKDLDLADYRTERTYMVEDYTPRPGRMGITLHASDALSFALKTKVWGEWLNTHPLEVFENIVLRTGVLAAQIDGTAFDPATYTSTISHWIVDDSGHENFMMSLSAPTSVAFDQFRSIERGEKAEGTNLLGDLQSILPGIITTKDDGKITFIEYDKTKAVDVHFTTSEYSNLKQEDGYARHYNQAGVGVGPSTDPGTCELNNDSSQADFAYLGTSARILSHTTSSRYLGAWAEVESDITVGSVNIPTGFGEFWGFCGTKLDSASYAFDTDTILSAARPAYWMIDEELIKITSMVLQTTLFGLTMLSDQPPAITTQVVPALSGATTAVRSQKGTTAAEHLKNTGGVADDGHGEEYRKIYDATIAVALNDYIVERFGYGCPVVSIDVGLDQGIYGLGDFVSIDSDEVVAYGLDGVSSSTKWEIISKRLIDNGTGWGFKLAFVQTVAPTITANIFKPSVTGMLRDIVTASMAIEDLLPHIGSGFDFSDGGGLDLDVGIGVGGVGGVRQVWPAAFTQALAASKDTYVSLNASTGAMIFREVTTGAGDPGIRANEARIGNVAVGGAALTTLTQTNETNFLNGNRMVDRSIKKDKIDMPIARAHLVGAVTVASAEGWKRIPFDTVDFDLGTSMFLVGKVYQADITEVGVYDIYGRASVLSVGTGYNTELAIYIAGAAYTYGPIDYNDSGGARHANLEVFAPSVELISTDVVEIYVKSTDPTARTIDPKTWFGFEIRRVR